MNLKRVDPDNKQGVDASLNSRIVARAGKFEPAISLNVRLRTGRDDFDTILALLRKEVIGRGKNIHDRRQIKFDDWGDSYKNESWIEFTSLHAIFFVSLLATQATLSRLLSQLFPVTIFEKQFMCIEATKNPHNTF